MSDEAEEKSIYIGGQKHAVVDPKKPTTPGPSLEEQLEAGVEHVRDQRDPNEAPGEFEDYLPDPEDHDRETFDVDEAAKRVQESAEYDSEVQQLEEDAKADEADRAAAAAVKQAQEWAPDDQQVLGHLEQRVQKFEQDRQTFNRLYKLAEGKELSPDQVQQFDRARERLQAEQAELQQAAQTVQKAATVKSAEAERRALYREFPEMAKAETRAELIEWAVSKGITRERALAETDPSTVGQAFRQMQSEKAAARQQHLDRPREPLYRRGGGAAGPMPDKITPRQAEERLEQTGSLDDALQVLTLRSERAREASE